MGLFEAGLLKMLCLSPVLWDDFFVENLRALIVVFDGVLVSESLNETAEGTESAVAV